MRLDTQIECPHCEETFEVGDVAVWHVCLTCGEIWPPGEQWHSHNWNDDVECGGCHAVRKYSREAAEAVSAKKLDEYRREHGKDPEWVSES